MAPGTEPWPVPAPRDKELGAARAPLPTQRRPSRGVPAAAPWAQSQAGQLGSAPQNDRGSPRLRSTQGKEAGRREQILRRFGFMHSQLLRSTLLQGLGNFSEDVCYFNCKTLLFFFSNCKFLMTQTAAPTPPPAEGQISGLHPKSPSRWKPWLPQLHPRAAGTCCEQHHRGPAGFSPRSRSAPCQGEPSWSTSCCLPPGHCDREHCPEKTTLLLKQN